MKVLVDTSIWSLALRRKPGHLNPHERRLVQHVAELIEDDRVSMIGPIRQELLSGVRSAEALERLKKRLRAYNDEPLTVDDYESAAEVGNACRAAGVSGSAVDFLICAVTKRLGFSIWTTDADFPRCAAIVSLKLYSVSEP